MTVKRFQEMKKGNNRDEKRKVNTGIYALSSYKYQTHTFYSHLSFFVSHNNLSLKKRKNNGYKIIREVPPYPSNR